MQIVKRFIDDVAVVELKGMLDYGAGDREFQEVIDDLTERGCVRLVVNLSEVSHMDTACLGRLIAAHVRFQRRRGGVHLLQTPPRIRALLSIARLEQVLVTFGTEEEAVRAFTVSVRARS